MRKVSTLLVVVAGLLTLGTLRSASRNRQFPVEDVPPDEDINVTSFEEIGYPVPALLNNVQGDVVVRVKLDGHGKVVLATEISGSRALAGVAADNAKKWQFRPNFSKAAVIIYEFRFADGMCGATLNQLFVFQQPNIASVTACPSHPQAASD